jgi:hypothetical protein
MNATMDPMERQYLNKNFIIRVAYRTEDGQYTKNQLIGAGMIYRVLPEEDLHQKLINKLMSTPEQLVEVKYRRGVKLQFQSR